MPKSLLVLIIFLAVLVVGMFILASMDVEQEPKLVEKPVIGEVLE